MSKDVKNAILLILVIIALWWLYIFSFNQFMNKRWNGGICPSCGYKYELKNRSNDIKYYVCPYCGKEVEKMEETNE